ncbi:MAG: site-2 protease family protein, partial [Candidatus Hydrothermarchaeales archaeon]
KEFEWILILNLFIGLTNLLPVYPLDGGRIFEEIAKVISPKGARHITSLVFAFVILLLFINLSPFLKIIF